MLPKERFAKLLKEQENRPKDKANFLIQSRVGAGKSFTLKTCPTTILIHSFDPGGTLVLRDEIEKGTVIADTSFEAEDAMKPTAFRRWETEVDDMFRTKFFDHLGTYVIDSSTTWIQAAFNEVQAKPKKGTSHAGQPPELQDHNYVQTYIQNRLQQLCSIPCCFILTAHLDIFTDAVDQKVHTSIFASGKLKVKIPMLFDEVYILQVEKKGPSEIERYFITGMDGRHEARTRIGAGKFPLRMEPNIAKILAMANITRVPKPMEE